MSFEIDPDGSVHIADTSGHVIISWTPEEYEDPSATIAALNAIRLITEDRIEELKTLIGYANIAHHDFLNRKTWRGINWPTNAADVKHSSD